MLTIGEKFPNYKLKATCGHQSWSRQFTDLDNNSFEGKWQLVFFYPKDFTFVCPTEINGV